MNTEANNHLAFHGDASGALLVFCTCPSTESAEFLAELLVERKLAACVNITQDLMSVYHWEGRQHKDREYLLVIKTHIKAWEQLEQALLASHPYNTPEIIALPIVLGNRDYLKWVEENLCID